MSSAQFAPARDAQPLDALIQQSETDGWGGLDKLFKPQIQAQELQPNDLVAKNLARFVANERGREIIEWILDISIRQPYRVTGHSLEETALHAAKRQGINGLAEAILSAVAHGNKLIENGGD